MSEWRFPSNDYGEKKGINDSGIAAFRGTPLRSLAREICQNSLDAARADTIRIEFSAFDIPTENLPGAYYLKDTFQRCKDFWSDQKAVTTKNFFNNAIEKISASKIHMLRISDFNTSGLTGSHEEINTNWTNLTKSSGVSDKKGSAGGSFGIGKFAPFACSDFSTVFYSTLDEDGMTASQGVSRLVTFRRADGQTTQGVGYYGEEYNTPTFSQLFMDPAFIRKEGEVGTDLYIAGYNHADDPDGWEKSIIISVLDSFLGAIWNNQLIVSVGEKTISHDSLNDLIEMYREELTGYTDKYYEVLKSEKTVWYKEPFMGIGSLNLGILLGNQDMPRKVAMIRSIGMKIKDQDHISSFIPFAGVMFINGENLNNELRELENPEHTEWQPDRSNNEIKARALLKSLNDFIKKKVASLAATNSQDEFDVAGLGSLLPDEIDDTSEEEKVEDVSDTPLDIQKSIPSKRPTKSSGSDVNGPAEQTLHEGGFVAGNSILGYVHGEKKRHTKKHMDPYPVDKSSDGNEKVEDDYGTPLIPEKIRVICMDKSLGKYIVMYVPSSDAANGILRFDLSGETEDYPAPILSASIMGRENLQISGNKIIGLEFKKGIPLRITLNLDYSDYCSMEVTGYANQK